MIRYSLVCAEAHEFDGWFQSGDDLDRQLAKGIVLCPLCNSARVEKSLMAPNLSASARHSTVAPEPVAPAAVPDRASFAAAPREMALRAALRQMRDLVTKNSEYVGDRFVDEARRIHYEESAARGIYGEASRDDANSLAEEGIEIFPLPVLPEEQN